MYACNEYISSQHPGLVQLLLKDSGFTDLFFFAAWLSSTARMYRLLTAAIGHSGTPATQQGSGEAAVVAAELSELAATGCASALAGLAALPAWPCRITSLQQCACCSCSNPHKIETCALHRMPELRQNETR